MDLATAAVGATASTAAVAYLNARWSLRKDLAALHRLNQAEKRALKLAQEGRLCPFYEFEARCKELPDIQGIWSREGCYTRRELYQRACQYGNYFLSLGVQPGERVAMYLMNSPEFLFAWTGLWAIGCAPAMINYNLTADPLVHCVKIADAKVLLVDQDVDCQIRVQDTTSRLENEVGVRIVILDDSLKSLLAQGDDSRPPDRLRKAFNSPHSPMALIYTSGTTGLPKAFGFETRRILDTWSQGREVWGLQPGKDVFYVCMPMYHGTGGVSATSRLLDGVTVAIGKKFSATGFWKDIRDSGATGFTYVGESCRYLLAAPPSSLDKEHKVRIIYGNGLRPDIWLKFQERFGIAEVNEFFSSTEGMLYFSTYSKSGFGTGTVGHHGLILRTLLRKRYVPVKTDESTGDVWRDPKTGFAKRKSYSEGGELIVRMDSKDQWPGYFNSPKATHKKFIYNVFEKGDMFYRPGDALRRDADGFWYFLDRLGDTFRWKGENVSTTEVSEILGRHPDIYEANVYGVTLPNHDGRAGCAAIELSQSAKSKPDWKDLTRFVRANLPKYAVPVFIRVMGGETGDMGTHNHKQNKVPYREEGVDPRKIGTKVPKGSSDQLFWLSPQAHSYTPFTLEKWTELGTGKLKL